MGVTTAKCTYSVVKAAGVFDYEVKLYNTSPVPYDVYSFLLGQQYNVPIANPLPLKNVVSASSPPGWSGAFASTYEINWQTNFQGSALASGYILPGQVGKFVFQSSTPPPTSIPFGCCFYYDGPSKSWGYCYNGSAQLVRRDSKGRGPFIPPPAYNPWWWVETHGGLVPPGPPPPWMQALLGALTVGSVASSLSPRLGARALGLALEQTALASAEIKKNIKSLKAK